eukprot:TRINITY_DN5095_c0_g2_i3.p1 TRINITY_DN5095_c0_g2~~TRINITY_DN5095_c0_g2_i3.p1  ORF type:complete len:434 (-),score=59.70 TRINITY_DN5095_c0_g2_i3:84-1385(-)
MSHNTSQDAPLMTKDTENVSQRRSPEDEGVLDELSRIQKLEELNTTRRWLIDFSNVFKSFIGSNFLGMPYAIRQSGVYAGMIGMIFIALITDHCCKMLVDIKNALPNNKDVKTYGDVGTALLGKKGRILVDCFLVLTQTGFCIGYTIFMAKNLDQLIHDHVPSPSYLICVVIIGCAAFPLTLVKNMASLGPFSLVADVALIVAMVMLYSLDHLGKANETSYIHLGGLPIFFGIVTSSYEGIGLVVPVEQTMTVQRFRYPMLLDLTLLIVTGLLMSFGVLGYLTYGDSTSSVITENLESGPMKTVVVIALILAILLTYPMQFYPVMEIFDRVFFKVPPQSIFHLRSLPIRVAGALFVGLIAYTLPFFGLISGLIGALGSSTLAFILPAMFQIILWKRKLRWYIILKNVLIIGFGGVALVVGTVFSIIDIVHEFL